jgi:sporulation protein YlmC with PRC-barrel domain
MRVDLHASLISRDGHEVGSIERAIVDPASDEIAEFVVNSGGLFGRDLLLPRAEIERATAEGDRLQLRLSRDELDRLPTFVSANFVPPPAGWAAPVGDPFGAAGYLWPAAYPVPEPYADAGAAAAAYATARGEVDRPIIGPSLAKGDVVLDRDDHEIGVVDDIAFDPATGRVTGFVLRIGGVLTTFFGGGETVHVDRDQLDRVEEARVRLNVSHEALRR